MQLEAERRVVIFDDFDLFPKSAHRVLFEYLESINARTVLLCRDTFGWNLVTKPGGHISPHIYRILPFKKS